MEKARSSSSLDHFYNGPLLRCFFFLRSKYKNLMMMMVNSSRLESFECDEERLAWIRAYGRDASTMDWHLVASRDEELRKCCRRKRRRDEEEDWMVDWTLAGARLAATRACLKCHFGIAWPRGVGENRLVPVVPNRLAFLAWIRDDLFGGTSRPLRGLDIGTGASCIYPLLGARCFGWSFVATESDEVSFEIARENLAANPNLDVRLEKVQATLPPVVPEMDFDFLMTNPPFFSDDDERSAACGGSKRRDGTAADAKRTEVVVEGGEETFVSSMLDMTTNIAWTTTLIGRKSSFLSLTKHTLKKRQDLLWKATQFTLGRTTRWAIAWTKDPRLLTSKFSFDLGSLGKKNIILNLEIIADRIRTFLASTFGTDYEVLRADHKVIQARSLSKAHPDLDITIDATKYTLTVALAFSFDKEKNQPNLRKLLASFNNLRDTMPGEIARTNRRWRRKLRPTNPIAATT